MGSVAERFRTRLLPALLLAMGVALLLTGLLSYTNAVEPAPVAKALESYQPLPTLPTDITLPGANGSDNPDASFPADRVATRIVIPSLRIDLPVIRQPPGTGDFPLCDVAMYLVDLGQPGSGRATYIYAHAREGMFYNLLTASQDRNGARMIGAVVEVYTSDDKLFLYQIFEVRRHQHDLADAFADGSGSLWIQTSEGPNNSYPKLQVVASFQSVQDANPNDAHPEAHPRECA
ncbi:MAG TPA: sortase [Candidatus Limnocylindrales bacterium]